MNGDPEMTTVQVVALALGLSCAGLMVLAMVIGALIAAARGLDIKYFDAMREKDPKNFRRGVILGRTNGVLAFLGSIFMIYMSGYLAMNPDEGPALLRIPGACGVLVGGIAFSWLTWRWLTWAWRTKL
jgi:hypothetical protein